MLYYFYMIYCKNFFEDDDCTSYYIGSYGENEKRYIGHKSDCNNPKKLLYNISLHKWMMKIKNWLIRNFEKHLIQSTLQMMDK